MLNKDFRATSGRKMRLRDGLSNLELPLATNTPHASSLMQARLRESGDGMSEVAARVERMSESR